MSTSSPSSIYYTQEIGENATGDVAARIEIFTQAERINMNMRGLPKLTARQARELAIALNLAADVVENSLPVFSEERGGWWPK